MKHAILIVGSPLGDQSDFDGKYVKSYDPHDGEHGKITVTPNLHDALIYPDLPAAFEAWRAVNSNRPKRPDGKPNRPMTAFTVEMVKVP
jgi:hypothetical protein